MVGIFFSVLITRLIEEEKSTIEFSKTGIPEAFLIFVASKFVHTCQILSYLITHVPSIPYLTVENRLLLSLRESGQ